MKNCRRQLQLTNAKLRARAHDSHRALLLQCCRVHNGLEDVAAIESIVQGMDYTDSVAVNKLLALADSLVDTKYSTAVTHYTVNQLCALIRKYPYPVRGLNEAAEERAVSKFMKYEDSCARINEIYSDPHHPMRAPEDLLHRMRSYIAYVMGDLSLSQIFDKCNFGPGASLGVHGNATNVKRKLLSNRWSVSAKAYDYARIALKQNIQIVELLVDPGDAAGYDISEVFDKGFRVRSHVVNNNNVIFVPKTTLTRRSIAVEPLLNGFLQKGIDETMRYGLMTRANIDLSDQSMNSVMAREGSLNQGNFFCTIDLSSASDSIASQVVKELLPFDWFYLLDRARSSSYTMRGKQYAYHKFCSMGNGFCFPLQTLLFAAASFAVGGGVSGVDFRVYGDDIIIRRDSFEPLVALLVQLGFDINRSKTFSSGPFRESCGGDFYLGADVRPVYLDYALDSVSSIIKFHNSWLRSDICKCFSDPFRHILTEMVPKDLRLVAPDYSDVTDQAFRVPKSSHEYLSSMHTSFSRRLWCTRWKEFVTTPISDRNKYGASEREHGIAVLYAALSGADSQSPFAYRRKTRTNIRTVAYG